VEAEKYTSLVECTAFPWHRDKYPKGRKMKTEKRLKELTLSCLLSKNLRWVEFYFSLP